jgi:hypothetical protein
MVLLDGAGIRSTSRIPLPQGAASCVEQSSLRGETIVGGGHRMGSGFGGRIRDHELAGEAATAAMRGNLLKIGLNEGTLGMGSVLMYRPMNAANAPAQMLEWVEKYDYQTNRTFQRFPRTDSGFAALNADLLATLRKPTFRVLAFGDAWADRVYSEIKPVSIQYTVPVAERLTAFTTQDDVVCKQDFHTRQGARFGQKWQQR